MSKKCECCGGSSDVNEIQLFKKKFIVCAYCRGDAKDAISETCIWRRQNKEREGLREWTGGSVVVLEGKKELLRKGFGLNEETSA